LLIQLTRNNTNIQKIVAFENAFERLFDIIHDEGNCGGGEIWTCVMSSIMLRYAVMIMT